MSHPALQVLDIDTLSQALTVRSKSWKVFLFQQVYSYPVYDRCCEVGQKDLDSG